MKYPDICFRSLNTEFVNRENEVRNNLRKSKHNFSPEINYIHIRTGINYLKKIVELIEELRLDYTFEEDTRDYKVAVPDIIPIGRRRTMDYFLPPTGSLIL